MISFRWYWNDFEVKHFSMVTNAISLWADLEVGLQGVDVVVDGDSAVGGLGALAVEEGF